MPSLLAPAGSNLNVSIRSESLLLWEMRKEPIGIPSTCYGWEVFVFVFFYLILWHITSRSYWWQLDLPVGALVAFPNFCDFTVTIYLPLAFRPLVLSLWFPQCFFLETHLDSFHCGLCVCAVSQSSQHCWVCLLTHPVPLLNLPMGQIFIQHCFMQNISISCISHLLAY